MLDAGNALFESVADSPATRAKAELLAQVMGELGTAAMAVGRRDLSAGADFALAAGRKAHLPMLSVNLRRKGTPLFPASRVLTAGGLRIALIGVSPAGQVGPDREVVGELPVALAVAEAKRLRPKADVVIALAAVSTPDALQLSRDAGEAIDLILQSSEMRAGAIPGIGGGAPVFPTGFEGRDLRTAALSVSGPGPFVLLSERTQLEQRQRLLTENLKAMQARLGATPDPVARKPIEDTIANFQTQLTRVEADLKQASKPAGRTIDFSVRVLDPQVKGDPPLEKRVAKLEPSPPAH